MFEYIIVFNIRRPSDAIGQYGEYALERNDLLRLKDYAVLRHKLVQLNSCDADDLMIINVIRLPA